MKKILSLVLILTLCFAMAVPAAAAFPETLDEMKTRFKITSDTPVEDGWVAQGGTLYAMDYEDVLQEVTYKGYNLLASDSVITVKNVTDETDCYVWLGLDVYQKNAEGKYVNDHPVGNSLRKSGRFLTRAAAEDFRMGDDARLELSSGESVAISRSTPLPTVLSME